MHEATEQTGDNATTDYRYIGANPNNYVCLESDRECTDDELYRIVGVIPTQSTEDGNYENRVKLVKFTTLNGRNDYQWSGRINIHSTYWSKSTLNTETLNKEYWDEISNYQQYIDPAKWYLGIYNVKDADVNDSFVSTIYRKERDLTGYELAAITNIGLIYPSDYGYATGGDKIITREMCLQHDIHEYGAKEFKSWGDSPEYLTCVKNDWVYQGKNFYLLNPIDKGYGTIFTAIASGLGCDGSGVSYGFPIYPSFYLKTGVKYLSGTGEKEHPYLITISANE